MGDEFKFGAESDAVPEAGSQDSWTVAHSARLSAAASFFGPAGLPGQVGGARAGQPGLVHSPFFTHAGGGDTTQPGQAATNYNLPLPPQANPTPAPDGEDLMPDPDL